jgi:hypothetical protein
MALRLIAWLLTAAAAAAAPPAPAPLTCLARHYSVQILRRGDAWWVALPGGGELPFDDGRAKTPAERIERPDVEDMFAVPYRPGFIAIPEDEADDPGRARVEALFIAVYGARGEHLCTVRLLGQPLRVHRAVREAVARVNVRLRELLRVRPGLRAQLLPLGGGYARRNIAGTDRLSAHAYGIAIDINPRRAAYWRRSMHGGGRSVPASAIPDQAIVDAFEAEGFIWGGRWYHVDTMHFEYRPELLDPACVGPRQPREPDRSALPSSEVRAR